MYTATIFGMEKETIVVSENVCDLIDQFVGKERYDQTGCVEKRNEEFEAQNILEVSRSHDFIAFSYELFDNTSLANFRFLSLSNMKSRKCPKGQFLDHCKRWWWLEGEEEKKVEHEYFNNTFGRGIKINHMTGQLIFKTRKSGKMDIFRDMNEDSHMCSLKTPEGIAFANTSEDGKTIVTCGAGRICKWEFREGLKENSKMRNVYPDGKIRALIAKPVGHKYNVRKILRIFIIPVVIIASIAIFIKYSFNQTASKLLNKVFFNML